MVILVTGACGFIGSHMVPFLEFRGHKVFATLYSKQIPHTSVRWFHCDMRDSKRVTQIVRQTRPDIIFHLAAQSFPTLSWEDPKYTIEVNVLGTIYLMEAVKEFCPGARVVVACSSAEYGLRNSRNLKMKESDLLLPLHPYGISKVCQDMLAYQYYTNFGLDTVRIRIFNTTGPGKIGDVCSDLTRRAVELQQQDSEKALRVGNVNSRRTFCDVRDTVRGLWLAARKGKKSEVYNLGSARLYSIRQVIRMLESLTSTTFRLAVDQALLRSTDEPVILGDISKFRRRTGWKPVIPLRQTLADMLEFWNHELKRTNKGRKRVAKGFV